jgi:hypothetical protein
MEGEAKKRDVQKERYCLPAARGADPGVLIHATVRHVPPLAGFDGLSMMTEHIIRCNPFWGHLFVFCNHAACVVMGKVSRPQGSG